MKYIRYQNYKRLPYNNKKKKKENIFYLFLIFLTLSIIMISIMVNSKKISKLAVNSVKDDISTTPIDDTTVSVLKDNNIPTIFAENYVDTDSIKNDKIINPSDDRVILEDEKKNAEKKQEKDEDTVKKEDTNSSNKDEDTVKKEDTNSSNKDDSKNEKKVEKHEDKKIPKVQDKVKIFYAKRNGSKIELVSKEISSKGQADSLKFALQNMIKEQDKTKQELNLIPKKTKVNFVNIVDDKINVDLSNDFIINSFGTQGINLSLKQIVYCLSQNNKNAKVQFSIDGKTMDIIHEGISLKEPFSRNSKF